MPGQRPILAFSFIASLGITFQILACTMPDKTNSNLWPLIVYVFYILLPLPIMMSKRIIKETVIGMNDSSSARTRDIALFFTAGILVSSFALPIVLTKIPESKPVMNIIACFLVEIGNILCYSTLALFCMYFKPLAAF